ncbi:MAG: N-acetylmuramoyl-L-alanine amidase [Clostridiales bacterium]|nr:N-acetylmuramoyl-L-alanine amidase [Clostridiales bacterium]
MKKRLIIIWACVFAAIFSLIILYTFNQNDSAMPAANNLKTGLPTVIIDAGHGGVDGGAQSKDGTLEKDINLSVSLMLNDMLKCFGINTVMTRTEDISIHDDNAESIRQKKISDIHNRMKIINNTPNCIFVSIHQNHYTSSKYSGTQVFYSKNDPRSRLLADSIQKSVVSKIQPDNKREVKPSGTEIYLLYHSNAPAVLVECGFLSNAEEANKLKDNEYQSKMSFAVACGILDAVNSNTEEY